MKQYDLGERTLKFAKRVIVYVNNLPKNMANIEIGRQLIKSSGSTGANYIEAEEALSKKDFVVRIKISRKESKRKQILVGFERTAITATGRKSGFNSRSNRTYEDFWRNYRKIKIMVFKHLGL